MTRAGWRPSVMGASSLIRPFLCGWSRPSIVRPGRFGPDRTVEPVATWPRAVAHTSLRYLPVIDATRLIPIDCLPEPLPEPVPRSSRSVGGSFGADHDRGIGRENRDQQGHSVGAQRQGRTTRPSRRGFVSRIDGLRQVRGYFAWSLRERAYGYENRFGVTRKIRARSAMYTSGSVDHTSARLT